MCNPNAMNYQGMVNQPHAYYLRYFLNKGNNVFVWNYRGFGQSKGSPTPNRLQADSDMILKYCKETLNLTGKFAVYGRSLGGVATTHLSGKVDMIIVDRTFSSL